MPKPDYHAALQTLFPKGRGLFLAYDQGFEHGPSDFNDENADPDFILKIAAGGHYNGVIVHHGVAEKYYAPYRGKVPLILKMNGRTSLHEDEPVSLAVTTVEEAVSLGAAAVGYTVYVGSERESEMLAELGQIIPCAHDLGIPVFGWMYPRGRSVSDPHDPETILYAARVGLEIGVDVVKIYNPGDTGHLRRAVELVGKTKVVVAGGVREESVQFETHVKEILEAGAAGVAVGRNVWQSDDPTGLSATLRNLFDTA